MNEELKVVISAEVSKLKQNIDKAKKEVTGFKDKVKEASKNVDENFKKIGSSISTGMKAAATGIAAAGTALIALGASTQEYRAEQSKLTTAFETAGSSAEQAKSTYNDLFRVLGDSGQATEAAAHLAKLTTEEKALSEWTNICQGVYATFGDSLPIEGLTEAANETAKTGSLTGALADALNWAGISEDTFQESLEACNNEAEREALIRETLSGLYSDAAATYEENNAQVLAQNEAQAKLQETTAKLGEVVAPLITAFTSLASDALALVLPYIQQLAEQYMPVLQEILGNVTGKLAEAFEWVKQHQTLLAVMGGIITGIVAAIGLYNAVAAIKAAMAAAEVASVWGLVAAYAAQAAAMLIAIAPYVLIVAAIAAVIAIIVLCVKHWDKIKETVSKVWQSIKEWTVNAVNAVVDKFNQLKAKAQEKIQALKTAVVDGFSQMVTNAKEKAAAILSSVTSKFDEIKSKIKEKINGAKDAVKTAIDKIKDFFNFSWSLPKLKMPHISISGSFSLSPLSVPKFSIDWYAKGGVFDKTTLFPYGGAIGGLGENGAEAIVPLEKNLGWLDKLATMLNEKQGSRNIIMQVDGKTFAEISCDSINQLTRQRGALALNLI